MSSTQLNLARDSYVSIIGYPKRRCAGLTILLGLFLVGGCVQDVTHDPAYSSLVGSRFTLRQDVILDRGQSAYANYFAIPVEDSPNSKKNVLRAGNTIRVDRVFYNAYDTSWNLHPTAVVCDGPMKGAWFEVPAWWLHSNKYLDQYHDTNNSDH